MTNDDFWQALLNRDASADGRFVYGVHSTKIYCRPSCPARRPKRQGVSFFTSCERAAQAGFRACRRCRPDAGQSPASELVERACRLLESAPDASLSSLSTQLGISAAHLQRSFKKITGVSPRVYAEALRLKALKAHLESERSVLAAQNEAGFQSSRALYERAPAQLGMSPAKYRNKGQGQSIVFCTAPCPLGFLLIAATAKGICSIALDDAPEALEKSLRDEFRAAEIARDEGKLAQHVDALLRHLNGQQPHLDLPLDVRATAFQQRVWQELRAIGYGQTRTYSQVAQALNAPTAVRAVARACASNPVALAVPCHRVVREDGSLAGYRWGIERKKALLETEKNTR